jgi:hypothetical protein
MGQVLKTQIFNNKASYERIKEGKNYIHYFVLLSITVLTAMRMESDLTSIKSQIRTSVSERDYYQKKEYNEMIEQMKDYDGHGVALKRLDDTLPTYKHELDDEE